MWLLNSTVRGNRGYGIFINSSYGDVLVQNTMVADNGADGVRYVRFDPRMDDQLDRTDIYDFCMFPTTASQTYPISVIMDQEAYSPTDKECFKVRASAGNKFPDIRKRIYYNFRDFFRFSARNTDKC